MEAEADEGLRSVILGTLIVCLAIAAAPWFSGGQETIAGFVTCGVLVLASGLIVMQPSIRKLPFGFLARSYWALMLLGALSFIWTVSRYSTVVWLIEWISAGLAFWVAYVVATEKNGRRLMIDAYMWSAGIFSLAAIVMFMTTAYPRLTGWFYWPNPAASYLIPAILIAIDWMRRDRGGKRWWWAGLASGLMTTFWLTDSRAATIALVLVAGVYLFATDTPKKFWINFVFSLGVSLVLTLGLGEIAVQTAHHSNNIVPGSRFAQVASGTSSSLSDRYYYLKSAVWIWLAHPLVGSGAGTYQNIHPLYQGRVQSASASAHNEYIQILSELGIVGFAVLILLLCAVGGGVIRGLVEVPEMVPVALGALGLLIHFGLDIDVQYPALLILAAVLLGLIWSSGYKVHGRPIWAWPVVALAVLVPAISLYESDVWAARGSVAQNNGDYVTASADYGKAASGLVYNPTYVNAEGIDYYTVGAVGGTDGNKALALALATAKKGIHEDPDGSQQYQLEGRTLEMQGNLLAAKAAFIEALKLDKYNHPDYAMDLASAETLMNERPQAMIVAQTMMAQYPIRVAINRSLDPTLLPNLATLEAFVGDVYYDRGDMAQARAADKMAIRFSHTNLQAEALEHQLNLANH